MIVELESIDKDDWESFLQEIKALDHVYGQILCNLVNVETNDHIKFSWQLYQTLDYQSHSLRELSQYLHLQAKALGIQCLD